MALKSGQKGNNLNYKNGRKAMVGDSVVGTTHNTNNELIAGTVVSLTYGVDSCSAMVGYLKVIFPTEDKFNQEAGTLVKVQGSEDPGYSGKLSAVYYLQDYTKGEYLLHAEDAAGISPSTDSSVPPWVVPVEGRGGIPSGVAPWTAAAIGVAGYMSYPDIPPYVVTTTVWGAPGTTAWTPHGTTTGIPQMTNAAGMPIPVHFPIVQEGGGTIPSPFTSGYIQKV